MRRLKVGVGATVVLALAALVFIAAPAQASHTTVVTVSGDVDFGGFVVHVGARATGAAASLSGKGFDTPGKPFGAPTSPPGYCHFPLTGTFNPATNVVTLTGTVSFSPDPANVGVVVTITADADDGSITFNFGAFTGVGTGSVVIAHS